MNTRECYKANHSELRSFGRFAKNQEERATLISKACADRRFWLDDPKANGCGIAALKTLSGMHAHADMLAMLAPDAAARRFYPAAMRSASMLRKLSYTFYFSSGRLPR